MIHQSLGENSRSGSFRHWNGDIPLGIPCFEKFFGLLRHRFEMSELFLVKLGADLSLLCIWFATEASHETRFDHLGQITLRFEMELLAKHACGFDILNTVEQNECLER